MSHRTISRQQGERISGGVFLIGLALLFMTKVSFWPGILFVLGAASLARGLAEGRQWRNIQGALWLVGLGLFFSYGLSMPFLLFLIGGVMLFGYFFRPSFLGGRAHDLEEEEFADFADELEKPKRKLKREGGLEYYDEEDL